MKNSFYLLIAIAIMAVSSCKNSEPKTKKLTHEESDAKFQRLREINLEQAMEDSLKKVEELKNQFPNDLTSAINRVASLIQEKSEKTTTGLADTQRVPVKSWSISSDEGGHMYVSYTMRTDKNTPWAMQIYSDQFGDLCDFWGDGFAKDKKFGDAVNSHKFSGDALMEHGHSVEFMKLPMKYQVEADSLYYEALLAVYIRFSN